MCTVIVIPARCAFARLPGKPLADILGKPMIQHVYERAKKVSGVDQVVVATDDASVMEAVVSFGGVAVITSSEHVSGSDRLVEVMHKIYGDLYVNLQDDEPLVRPTDIARSISSMRDEEAVEVGTLCHPIDANEALNPNCVKVVLAESGDALYFSRSPIPYQREESEAEYLKHVGLYAYRRRVWEGYSQMPQPMLEKTELLEQLRLLHAGIRIRAFQVEPAGPGVDTPECLTRVRAIMAGQADPSLVSPLSKLRLAITDVDGVLIDGGIYYDATGECQKRFHVRDGLGVKMLEECGIQVAIVSGRDSAALCKRVADLGATLSRFGVKDKAAACRDIVAEANVGPAQTACIGDDSIYLPAFAVCGVNFAVADAPIYVRNAATHTLQKKGGEGAFREVSDQILAACGYENVFASHHGFAQVMHRMAQRPIC